MAAASRCGAITPSIATLRPCSSRFGRSRDGSTCWSTTCGAAMRTVSAIRCHAFRSGEQSFDYWDRMFTAGVRAHLVASRLAVPLMLPQRRGLIATTTAHLEPLPYLKNIFYEMSRYSVARMTWAMARELREHGIAAVAVAPGLMRTERVEEAFRACGRHGGAQRARCGPKETTAYLGRAIVALVSDPLTLEKSGQVLSRDACSRNQFTDVDGSQPPPFRIPAPASA